MKKEEKAALLKTIPDTAMYMYLGLSDDDLMVRKEKLLAAIAIPPAMIDGDRDTEMMLRQKEKKREKYMKQRRQEIDDQIERIDSGRAFHKYTFMKNAPTTIHFKKLLPERRLALFVKLENLVDLQSFERVQDEPLPTVKPKEAAKK